MKVRLRAYTWNVQTVHWPQIFGPDFQLTPCKYINIYLYIDPLTVLSVMKTWLLNICYLSSWIIRERLEKFPGQFQCPPISWNRTKQNWIFERELQRTLDKYGTSQILSAIITRSNWFDCSYFSFPPQSLYFACLISKKMYVFIIDVKVETRTEKFHFFLFLCQIFFFFSPKKTKTAKSNQSITSGTSVGLLWT